MNTRLPIAEQNANPLQRDVKILNLSTQSSSGYLVNGDMKSKAYYEIKNYIDLEGDNTVEYVSVSMPFVVLCNSNYNINSYNNQLTISLTNAPTSTTTYTLPVGNYNATQFIQQMILTVGAGFTFSLDTRTNKFTITNNNSRTWTMSGTMDYIIGFSGTLSSSGVGYSAVCPRVCNFLPCPRFNICCDFLNNGTLLGNSSSFSTSTILASVPNTSKNNTQIVWESDMNEFILKNPTLNTLTISIIDDNNNLIDFNGVSTYFQLRFSIYRRIQPKLRPFNQIVDYASAQFFIPDNAQELGYSYE